MRYLILNASQILTLSGPDRPKAGKEMSDLGLIAHGAVLIEDGKIAWVGSHNEVGQKESAREARILNADGRVVMPGFVDSHTHPVFCAPRLEDFGRRIRGATYAEIAQNGGGVLSSVQLVREASESDLAEKLRFWAGRFLECGTTTLEAKSGYGLDLETELKMLRAMGRVAEGVPLEIVPTLLGAHAIPPEFKDDSRRYVELVCRDMIPQAAQSGLARFVDVFCESGYFSVEASEEIFNAGIAAGLKLKIHADQMTRSGGSQLAAKVKAISADHLDCALSEDFTALKASGAIATLLPAANLFMGSKAYPQAREMIQGEVPVALATDFNPGTSPCWNMQTVIALACSQMGMTPEEAIVAATVNGAYALDLGGRLGSLQEGKQADLILLDIRDYREVAYYFGCNLVRLVMKKGKVVHSTYDYQV